MNRSKPSEKSDEGALFSRATALAFLAGGAATIVGCAGGASGALSASAATAAPGASSSGTTSSACTQTLEGEIGPYFADDALAGFNRSLITSNIDGTGVQGGVPLTLTVQVVDAKNACAPMSGVQIDIWHCNASGLYSDEASENTSSQTYLRGYQVTGSAGTVTFQTIVPGWYAGRTTHVHLRARSSYNNASSTGDGSNTTQAFFPQALIDSLATSVAPYSAEGKNPTTNASDHVYAGETKGTNVLTLTGSTASGYAASLTIALPIA